MKIFFYSKRLIFKEIAFANLFLIIIALIVGGNAWITILTINVFTCAYKILTPNVLKINIRDDQISILQFRVYKFTTINISLTDVQVYFIKKPLGRGSPADALIFDNNKGLNIAEISVFLSGFDLERLKEIHKYITALKVTNGGE